MPRYFFDFLEGRDRSPDVDGIEFANCTDAYGEATKAAEEMWGELLARRVDPRRCAFEIRDEKRRLLFVLWFHEVLNGCRHPHTPSTFINTLRESTVNIGYAKRVVEEFHHELKATRSSLDEAMALIARPI